MKELVSQPINLYAHIVNEIYSFFKNNPEILHIGIIKNKFIPLSSKFEISLRDKNEKKEYGYFSNNQTGDENIDKIVTLVSYFNFVYDKWINDGNKPFAINLLISREEYPFLNFSFDILPKEVLDQLNQDTLDYFKNEHFMCK